MTGAGRAGIALVTTVFAVLGGAFPPAPFRSRLLPPSSRPVVVASKPFGESYLLAEMFAQLLEARGFVVERRPGLGATELAFQAIRTGAIDVYPEYTGTGLTAILHEAPLPDPRDAFTRVSVEFARRWDVHWLPDVEPGNLAAATASGEWNLTSISAPLISN